MAHPKVKLSDDSGNAVSVTGNRLDVNAYLSATPEIDIGDVSLLLGGTAASVNNGASDATTLRVTIASDTTGVLSVDDNGSTLSIDDGGGSITIDGTVDLGSTATTHLSEIEGAVETIEGAVSGSEMQVDVVASLPAGTNIIGKVSHDITGGADGVTTVSSAGTDVVLGGNVVCKKIDIQAQTDNTGLIAVGFTGVDATEATGTGVILYAGDTYSLEMVNLNLIYIDSTVSGEGVRYTYFT